VEFLFCTKDFSLLEDTDPWHHLGYFFENCRQYLCRADAGIPPALVSHADDLARRVANLAMLFEGDGSEIAAKVGEVVANWVVAHHRLLQYPDRPKPPPFDLEYKSVVWTTGISSTKQVRGAAEWAEQSKVYASAPAPAEDGANEGGEVNQTTADEPPSKRVKV